MLRARLCSLFLGGARPLSRAGPSAGACLTVAVSLLCLPPWAANAKPLDPLAYPSLGALNLSGGNFTIDTDALTIVDDAAPGAPLFTGVIDDQRGLADSFGPGADVTTVGPLGIPHIAVFTFDGITLETSANITVIGHRALALLSQGDALVNTMIDVSGSGEQNGQQSTGRPGGPGGFAGGTGLEAGFGPGGGASGGTPASTSVQGSSGGFGGRGGEGHYHNAATYPPGGPAYGDLTGVLQAGSGGGGGGDINSQLMVGGGGGGGAIEIGAISFLEIGESASLLADGGFGQKDALSSERGGGGSGGGVRLHGRELRLEGLISASGSYGGSDIFSQLYGGGGGGRVLLAGNPAVFLVGSAPLVSEFTTGINVADSGFQNSMFGVIGHVPLVTVVPGSQSFELGTVLSLQTATGARPAVEVIPHDLSVFGEVTVPAGGATNIHAVELKTPAARLTGADPLTNEGLLSGSGHVEVELTNAAGGQISAANDSLTFTHGVTNNAGAQINAINSTLDFQAGLTNNGQLNLINATILGGVSGGATGAASFVGDNSVGGDLAMAAGDSLAVRLGGTAPVQFDSLAVSGDGVLAGSLGVSLTGGFTLAPSQSFAIVNIAGTASGSFASLTEGALVGTFGGTDLFITYASGDGNDVALFTAPPAFTADFDDDGDVDRTDYDIWVDAFDLNLLGDADGDNDSDGLDFLAWQQQFGSVPAIAAASAVPEPATSASLLIVVILAITRRGAFVAQQPGGCIVATRHARPHNSNFG